eukprot:jgi/Mesen1/1512/ME000132S00462
MHIGSERDVALPSFKQDQLARAMSEIRDLVADVKKDQEELRAQMGTLLQDSKQIVETLRP